MVRATVAGRTGFLAPVDLAGGFLVGVTGVRALDFFPGFGVGEGEELGWRIEETTGRGERLRGAVAAGAGLGIEAGGGAAGTGGIDAAAGTALVGEPPLDGEDFGEVGISADTGAAAGVGVTVGALAGGRLFRRIGVVWTAGAVAGMGEGDGGVGTGSFFPVRGERDLGGMSRTLRDADHRLGFRLPMSLNWLSQAAQTVFPKVLIWWIGRGESLER